MKNKEKGKDFNEGSWAPITAQSTAQLPGDF